MGTYPKVVQLGVVEKPQFGMRQLVDWEALVRTDTDMPDGHSVFGIYLKKFPDGWKALWMSAVEEGKPVPWREEAYPTRLAAAQGIVAEAHEAFVAWEKKERREEEKKKDEKRRAAQRWQSAKQSLLNLVRHHRENDVPDCGVELCLIREIAENAGLEFTEEEKPLFI